MTQKAWWRASAPGRYVDVEWRLGDLYFEDGPDDWPRRGHEGMGGTLTADELRQRTDLLEDYDGFRDRLLASLASWFRAIDAPRGVLATSSPDGVPHAVPCCFVAHGSRLYTPIDDVKPKTSTRLRRLRNITENPRVSLLVDEYHDDWDRLWWVRIDGTARLVDEAWEIERASALLREKYPQYADAELQVIAVEIDEIRSWPDDIPSG